MQSTAPTKHVINYDGGGGGGVSAIVGTAPTAGNKAQQRFVDLVC